MILNVLGAALLLAAFWAAVAISRNNAGMRYSAFPVREPVRRSERFRREP
jgi:hypothetical protein